MKKKKNLLDIANVGMVLNESAYAKIVDMKPHQFSRSLEEGHYSDFVDKLTMLLSIHTQSGKGEVGQGAPKKDDNEISEAGATARDY